MILGTLENHRLTLEELHRFPNRPVNAEIKEGNAFSVSLTIDSNLQPLVTTEVKGDALIVNTKESIHPTGHSRLRKVKRYDARANMLRAQSMMTRWSQRSATRPASGKPSDSASEPGKRTRPAWSGVYSRRRCIRITCIKVLAVKIMKNMRISVPYRTRAWVFMA